MGTVNLNKVRMNVIQTADNGVVNKETIFNFTQAESLVYGDYVGGKIKKGFLVGQSDGNILKFSYCQIQSDDTLDNGISVCKLSANDTGKIQLIENFEWKSRPGEFGVNIFQEL